jgi:protein involved in polysaccharide export with SLBB domain
MLYPGEDFHLDPGDLILVHVFMQDYSQTVRLGADGSVHLPFIGSVPLQDLTVRAAQALIADRLRAGGFYKDPEVTIQVLDTVNGSVLVTGEVHSIVPVSTERSLREVLLIAGGLPATASHTVKIVRPGMAEPIVIDLGTDLAASSTANFPVHPHDIIQISRASVVYVLGAFQHQGAVPLDQATPLTLLQVASLSGGINFEGRYADLRLMHRGHRTQGGQGRHQEGARRPCSRPGAAGQRHHLPAVRRDEGHNEESWRWRRVGNRLIPIRNPQFLETAAGSGVGEWGLLRKRATGDGRDVWAPSLNDRTNGRSSACGWPIW